MKRILFCSILLVMLAACSSNDNSNKLPDDFNKNMRFEECFGDIDVGAGFCFEFMIEVLITNEEQQIKYSIDGNQTCRRLICDISKRNNEYRIIFNSYDEEDIHYSDDFTKGDVVFIIIKKKNHYSIKNFKSPFDGLLIQKEYMLKPL